MAIRKSNRVGTLSVTVAITSLSSIEVGVRVVISNSIGVGVWRRLIRVSNSSFDYRGMVSWGSMDNRGMVGWSSMDNRGSMDNWSMISWAVGKDSLGSVETIGGISNSSNSSTKSLGLCGASVFSLIWFGDRLVGHLSSWTTITSNKDWARSRGGSEKERDTNEDLHDS